MADTRPSPGPLDGAEEYLGELGKAVRNGDQLTSLVALRDQLADMMDSTTDARATASLSRQLVDVLSRIDACGGTSDKKANPVDQLAQRRKVRHA